MYVYIWRQGLEGNTIIDIWTSWSSCESESSVKLCLGLLEGICKQLEVPPQGIKAVNIY